MPSRKGKEKEGPSSFGVRGRNAQILVRDEGQRPVVRRIGHRSFYAGVGETEKVNKIISQIVRSMYHSACGKYSDFPRETQSLCKAKFLKYYKFLEDENIDEAWKTFSRIADKVIQNNLHKCKQEARKMCGDNIQE